MSTLTQIRSTSLPPAVRWHRPLLWLAAVMAVLTLFALAARFADPRPVTGLNAWDKPLKFAISTVIYAVTWSWLIGQLRRGRRIAAVAGSIITITLAVELAIITGAAAFGTTSHFNVTTPVHTAMWSVMAVSISVLWVATFIAAVVLLRNRFGDPARTLAIRLGALLSVLGLGLGYLMTGPTAQQLDDFQGIAGAHTVGLADGGPGLPILGWSTVAGDLRIPHFVGMHALQAIPLVLIAAELLSTRILLLRDVAVRTRLVWALAAGYLGVIALVTWQALRGQSIVQPDALTLWAGGALVAASLVAVAAVVVPVRGHRGSG
jgi:hypothetical protein